ncbi:MAG: Chondroitin synthase [Verrucomicrobia bacterium ADurb.Bin118]|nr:MAG: Chondroitin synthase [Verrucomicrobia bacterium ADurb.Bin118]
MSFTPDHISVCIPTYRRPELLERLLRNLAGQETGGRFTFSLVVVDNDAPGSARETVTRLTAELDLDLTYAVEPERTIPAVRNHALRLARGNYIGIIDDDEFPPPDWLLKMYQGIRTFAVDGALGPVYPFFAQTPPAWLVKSGLCELPSWRTGTLLHWRQTRTGNVLLKKAVFDQHGLTFDPQFKTGGSDQEFFRQAMARGCRFVAVQEAPVYEVVPPVRWTRWYWIRRSLVNGYNVRRYTAGMSRGRRMFLFLKSLIAVLAYALAVPIGACLGPHRLIRCLEKGAYHLSRTCATFGIELWNRRDF